MSRLRRANRTAWVEGRRRDGSCGRISGWRIVGAVVEGGRGTRRAAAFAPLVVGAVVLLLAGGTAGLSACTTIDPGPNFVVPQEQFNQDYFYCHVEPELLVARKCGSGDTGAGDTANGCHFNSSAVSGLALVSHDPVDCGGGDRPVGVVVNAAKGNLEAASIEMSREYLTAPLYIRPTGSNHPRAIFAKDDPIVDVIRTWASKP